jgi:hypothetical protein
MAKILGSIIGKKELVLDMDDVKGALVLVDKLPDPNDSEWSCVQLSTTEDANHVAGDIFRLIDGEWIKVVMPDGYIGPVTGIICPAYGNNVQIRWQDPPKINEYIQWDHTRIVRKYGQYPTDPMDGVIVCDSYVHNYYKNEVLHDFVPSGTVDNWFYRAFVFTNNGKYSSDLNCRFRPINLTLENLPSIIREGNGPKVYSIGDLVTVDGFEFEVAGFDTVELVDQMLEHSIVFVSHKCMYKDLAYDVPWGSYVLTADTVVTSRDKQYYKQISDGVFELVTGLRIGSSIPENTYYELNINTNRRDIGGNRWSKSYLRRFLNSNESNAPVNLIPEAIRNIVVESSVRTTLPIVDGMGAEYSKCKYFVPSLTEIANRNPIHVWYTQTHDVNPKELYVLTTDTVRNRSKSYFVFIEGVYKPATSSNFDKDGEFFEGMPYYEIIPKEYYVWSDELNDYRLAEASDFTTSRDFIRDLDENGNPLYVYYDKNEVNINENQHLSLFDITDLNPTVRKYGNETSSIAWWMRSADIHTDNDVMIVTAEGNVDDTKRCDSKLGVVVAFAIA